MDDLPPNVAQGLEAQRSTVRTLAVEDRVQLTLRAKSVVRTVEACVVEVHSEPRCAILEWPSSCGPAYKLKIPYLSTPSMEVLGLVRTYDAMEALADLFEADTPRPDPIDPRSWGQWLAGSALERRWLHDVLDDFYCTGLTAQPPDLSSTGPSNADREQAYRRIVTSETDIDLGTSNQGRCGFQRLECLQTDTPAPSISHRVPTLAMN